MISTEAKESSPVGGGDDIPCDLPFSAYSITVLQHAVHKMPAATTRYHSQHFCEENGYRIVKEYWAVCWGRSTRGCRSYGEGRFTGLFTLTETCGLSKTEQMLASQERLCSKTQFQTGTLKM